MNKLTVLIGNNTQGVFEEVIKNLKNYFLDMSHENIIIVPDRLSLLAEQKIFELLGIDVYFNISVMGISKFASKIIAENNLEVLECSVIQTKLLVLRAIQNVKNKFKCFSCNFNLGFVDEIYAKIEQIKSSNVNIDDLYDDKASVGTKLKFEDLKLIYNEYENLRANRLDSGALLTLFNNVCEDSASLRNANVFFVGFDSMTKQGLQVLNNVIKTALTTFVGVVAPNSQSNENIYDKTFLTAIINLCKEQKFESDFRWENLPLKNECANTIINNIFTRKNKFENNDYFNIYRSTTIADEIDFITKSINYNIKTKNIKFNDIAICSPKDYHEILKTKLSSLNIDVYADTNYPLLNLEPIKYILNILKFLIEPQEKNNFIKIILSDFCELEKNKKELLLNYLSQYSSIYTVRQMPDMDEEILKTINYYLNINVSGNSVNNYIELIESIINNEKIIEKTEKICDILEKNGEIALQKLYLQVGDKLTKILEQIKDVMQADEMSLEEFYNIFEKAVIDTELMGVPSTINQVFIGDTKSFYGNVKYLYIMCANDGVFPEVLADSGLISDKEICSESIKAVLEPTTKIINKRNKFKALEVILSASEKCYLSYHTISGDNRQAQPAEFITELKYLFGNKEIDTDTFKIYEGDKIELNKICFNNEDLYNANLNLRKNESSKIDAIISGALLKENKLYFKQIKNDVKVNFSTLFFGDGKASISIIEKYNACPRASFLANALKLKKVKKDKVEANIIGSFIHEVAERFVKINKEKLGKLKTEEIENSVEEICKQIILDEQYYSINLEENLFIFNLIKKECKRFCNFINYEQTVSDFKPLYTEKYFGKNSNFKPLEINVDGKDYIITGIVDRIDVCVDSFRIIDYKSGNTTNAKGKENLYYGTKIQLFVYAEAIRLNMGKNLFGAFFLPIKNSFNATGSADYYLSGFFTASTSLVMSADKNLSAENRNSKLLNCSLNKPSGDGEIVLSKKDNILTEDELNAFNKYSVEIVKKSISDISSGFIECSPLAGKCSICEFKPLCKFADDKRVERTEKYAVTKESFLEFDYGK